MRVLLLTAAAVIGSAVCHADAVWVKGNTHCHSTLSDGNVPPEAVFRWYREHGYGFVVLTDHDKVWPAEVFAQATDDHFVAIAGEEVTTHHKTPNLAVHVNALGVSGALAPIEATDTAAVLVANVSAIVRAGAVAQVNHPGFHVADGRAITRLKAPFLVEVYNHSTRSGLVGPMAQFLFERVWDMALSAGRQAFGIATDDAHDYLQFGRDRDNPGGGWAMVRVSRLEREEILRSLASGDFYASTGVEIAQCRFDGRRLRVCARPAPGRRYTIRFIGREGRILREVAGPAAEYRVTGGPGEPYVRVRIRASDGSMAWTQPVRPGAPWRGW